MNIHILNLLWNILECDWFYV